MFAMEINLHDSKSFFSLHCIVKWNETETKVSALKMEQASQVQPVWLFSNTGLVLG